jgi:hypothetical protein
MNIHVQNLYTAGEDRTCYGMASVWRRIVSLRILQLGMYDHYDEKMMPTACKGQRSRSYYFVRKLPCQDRDSGSYDLVI